MTPTQTLTTREILAQLISFPTVSRDTNLPLVDWVQDYLAAHGMPQGIDALAGHQMVGFVSSRTGEVIPLEFRRDGRLETRALPSRVETDNSDTAAELALNGLGLIQAPRYRFADDFARSTLVEVLADHPPTPTPLAAYWPQNRQLAARVRVFVDWVAGIFAAAEV